MSKKEKLIALILDNPNPVDIARDDLVTFLTKIVGCTMRHGNGTHDVFTYTCSDGKRKNIVVPKSDPIRRYSADDAKEAYYNVYGFKEK